MTSPWHRWTRIMAAISVFGPQARTTETAIETIVAGLQRVAVELSRDFSPEA